MPLIVPLRSINILAASITPYKEEMITAFWGTTNKICSSDEVTMGYTDSNEFLNALDYFKRGKLIRWTKTLLL